MIRMFLMVAAAVAVLHGSGAAYAGGGGKTDSTIRVVNHSDGDIFVVINPPTSWQTTPPTEAQFLRRATLITDGNSRNFSVKAGTHNVLVVDAENPDPTDPTAIATESVTVGSKATTTLTVEWNGGPVIN